MHAQAGASTRVACRRAKSQPGHHDRLHPQRRGQDDLDVPAFILKSQRIEPAQAERPASGTTRPRAVKSLPIRKPIKPQALTRGVQATKRPDHKLPPAAALHKWWPQINNVNARLRQNQWPDFRVNTGEGSILEAQVFNSPGF
jgi:hypothetical protein